MITARNPAYLQNMMERYKYKATCPLNYDLIETRDTKKGSMNPIITITDDMLMQQIHHIDMCYAAFFLH